MDVTVTNKTRIIVFGLLVLLGVVLLGYGAFVHSADVLPEKEDGPPVTKSEPLLVKEASIGGVERDDAGNIRLTYTGAPPKACPT